MASNGEKHNDKDGNGTYFGNKDSQQLKDYLIALNLLGVRRGISTDLYPSSSPLMTLTENLH